MFMSRMPRSAKTAQAHRWNPNALGLLHRACLHRVRCRTSTTNGPGAGPGAAILVYRWLQIIHWANLFPGGVNCNNLGLDLVPGHENARRTPVRRVIEKCLLASEVWG